MFNEKFTEDDENISQMENFDIILDDELEEISKQLMKKNLEAYKELAK